MDNPINLVRGTPAFLFAAVSPFPACHAQTPVLGCRLVIAWIISAVVLVSAANYLIRPLWPINDWKLLGGFLWAEPAHLPQYAVLFVRV